METKTAMPITVDSPEDKEQSKPVGFGAVLLQTPTPSARLMKVLEAHENMLVVDPRPYAHPSTSGND